jgi:MarR family transcriptional regulator, organic hydroperoxide resistance regulator
VVARQKLQSPVNDSMGYLVRRTYRNMTRGLEVRLLWEGDGKTQKELTEELGLRQPTTVSAMDTLEKRLLVRRAPNPNDRRSTLIYLTEGGRSIKAKLLPYADEANSLALKDLSRSEIGTLRKLLLKINATLESNPSVE